MAGALLGALSRSAPTWPIQDRVYLESDARRLALIALGEEQASFSYPDVSTWEAPSSQSDAVVRFDGGLALVGLGKVRSLGQEYRSGGFVWQWFELPFGQSVLAKRRVDIDNIVNEGQLPGKQQRRTVSQVKESSPPKQERFELEPRPLADDRTARKRPDDSRDYSSGFPGIDKATDIIISSGFNDATIGRLINQCIEDTGSIEVVVSLTAILAKAKVARMKRK
jgi:hypothetical protein